jgi:hypothetical protein
VKPFTELLVQETQRFFRKQSVWLLLLIRIYYSMYLMQLVMKPELNIVSLVHPASTEGIKG